MSAFGNPNLPSPLPHFLRNQHSSLLFHRTFLLLLLPLLSGSFESISLRIEFLELRETDVNEFLVVSFDSSFRFCDD